MFELNLTNLGARLTLAVLVLAGCSLLIVIIVSRFVIGTLANGRLPVTRGALEVPLEYFPGSARLNARLATAELSESDRNLASAAAHARRAIKLSPFDYRFQVTMALIEEASGDRRAAEETLRAASALAPNHWSVQYRLANLLVRQGKLAESFEFFRKAVVAKQTLLPGTLDLVWRASRGDFNSVRSVCEGNASANLALAQFMLGKSRPREAVEVFNSIPRDMRVASPTESSAVLNSLIAAGQVDSARELWSDLTSADRQATLIWNGGFESDISKSFSQFDWSLGGSDYARLSIDPAVSRSGSRSLKLEFAGRDTTRLDNEIRQLVPVRPGARYLLECYARTNELVTPEGPRIVVTDAVSSTWIAASEPIATGSGDWRQLSVTFVVPQSARGAVLISIKRKPKFSYDEPTSGTVWFDGFSMKEQ